jgi:hypothetical protein
VQALPLSGVQFFVAAARELTKAAAELVARYILSLS